MKSIEDAHKVIDGWYNAGCVGNLVLFRAPRRDGVEIILEETKKLREMPPDMKMAAIEFFSIIGGDKVEVVSDGNGKPDRAKVTRRIT